MNDFVHDEECAAARREIGVCMGVFYGVDAAPTPLGVEYRDVQHECQCVCHQEPEEFDSYRCMKCNALPKDCVWQCRSCKRVAEAIPYPAIGCQCIAATYTCDACLAADEPQQEGVE